MKFNYKPYSFSKLDVYNTCPLKFKRTYLGTKIKKVEGFFLDKGSMMHEMIEHKLENKVYPKTNNDFKFLDEEDEFKIKESVDIFSNSNFFNIISKKKNFKIEAWCSLDYNLNPTDKWPNKLINGKIDYGYYSDKSGCVIDWKSTTKGVESLKRFPKDTYQLELYALWALQNYNLDKIHTMFYFVDCNHIQQEVYYKTDVNRIRDKIMNNILQIENDKNFLPKVGPLCNWCDFKKNCPEFKDFS